MVVGEPGLWKEPDHRRADRARAEACTRRCSSCRASRTRTRTPYGPVARALTCGSGSQPGEDPAESRDKIQAMVSRDGARGARRGDRAPGGAPAARAVRRQAGGDAAARVAAAPRGAPVHRRSSACSTAEAEKRPVVLVVEDLELCGNDTINFLQYLAAGMRDQPVAILGTATAALYDRHPAFGEGEVPADQGQARPAEARARASSCCASCASSSPMCRSGSSIACAHSAARRAQSTSSCGCCWRAT